MSASVSTKHESTAARYRENSVPTNSGAMVIPGLDRRIGGIGEEVSLSSYPSPWALLRQLLPSPGSPRVARTIATRHSVGVDLASVLLTIGGEGDACALHGSVTDCMLLPVYR